MQDSIDRAVRMVREKATPPMKGIRILKRLAGEHPENAKIQWHLGRFSVRSGQYEKAARRFEKVLEIAPQTYQDAYLYLGKTYATLGDTSKAIQRLQKFRSSVEKDSLRKQVDGLLRSLQSEK
ncbi:MAG: tol-pal system YbgF family protein [Flavobacteriales bacterium]